MKALYVFTLLFLFGSLAKAQDNYEVSLEQSVFNDTLFIDYYIQKISGQDIPLGSCDFAATFNSNALDIDSAIIDDRVPRPFDLSSNPSSYRSMLLGKNSTTLNLIVRALTSGSGTGTLVTSTRTRVGRVAIPILVACDSNQPNWLVSFAGMHAFDQSSIKQSINFASSSTTPLCEAPADPSITAATNSICSGESVTLRANSNDSVMWYKDGVLVQQSESDSLVVTQSGSYVAQAYNCSQCVSSMSTTYNVDVTNPPVKPIITLNSSNGELIIDGQDGTIEWFLDGVKLNGASDTNLAGASPGAYTVTVTNKCGTVTSDPYVITTNDLLSYSDNFYFFASPNPFSGVATMTVNMPRAEVITVDMMNVVSQQVKRVEEKKLTRGTSTIDLNGAALGLSSGTYILNVGYIGRNYIQKLVYTK